TTPVYTRADATSFSMAALRRGYLVEVVRAAGDFLQVHYAENDRYPDPQYKAFELLGWIPANSVTGVRIRHFAWLTAPNATPPSWTNFDDFHNFTWRWHPLDSLPELVIPQAPWLRYLPR